MFHTLPYPLTPNLLRESVVRGPPVTHHTIHIHPKQPPWSSDRLLHTTPYTFTPKQPPWSCGRLLHTTPYTFTPNSLHGPVPVCYTPYATHSPQTASMIQCPPVTHLTLHFHPKQPPWSSAHLLHTTPYIFTPISLGGPVPVCYTPYPTHSPQTASMVRLLHTTPYTFTPNSLRGPVPACYTQHPTHSPQTASMVQCPSVTHSTLHIHPKQPRWSCARLLHTTPYTFTPKSPRGSVPACYTPYPTHSPQTASVVLCPSVTHNTLHIHPKQPPWSSARLLHTLPYTFTPNSLRGPVPTCYTQHPTHSPQTASVVQCPPVTHNTLPSHLKPPP